MPFSLSIPSMPVPVKGLKVVLSITVSPGRGRIVDRHRREGLVCQRIDPVKAGPLPLKIGLPEKMMKVPAVRVFPAEAQEDGRAGISS